MDPALIGTRLASSAVAPLIRRLFVIEGPGAGLPEERVRLSRLVSFRGEQRTLSDREVRKLATALVRKALDTPGEAPFPYDEGDAVADALARTLLALGDLDMDDVQAVHLGHRELARRLRGAGPAPDWLSRDATLFLDSLTEWACLHIVHFFTQRSTFAARTLVEQSRAQAELIAKVDALIARTPRADAADPGFERRYHAYLARKHGSLTIYGIDLHHSPDSWPLDVAYLSLAASARAGLPPGPDTGPHRHYTPRSVRRFVEEVLPERPASRPADLVLADHERVLLRGVAGSGKTTLIQWLAVSAATAGDRLAYLRDRIPLVLPLRTLTRHGRPLPTPDRFLSAVGCPLSPPDGWADRVLSAGRGLILVDGIDEVPEPERERARGWLRDLLAAYDGNRWLVTSRPSAVRDDWLAGESFAELTLSPMNRTEVTAFVRRWHAAAGMDAEPYEQPLLDALRGKQDLARLATNPLMCGLICALHRDRHGFLPRGRKELYAAALSMLLIRRDRERDMPLPVIGEEPQIQLLQRLAYWLIRNGRTEMDRAQAEVLIAAALPAVPEAAALGDAPAVFDHFLQRSGLLREPSPGTVDFIHRTFQDYLGARAAVDEGDFGLLAAHAPDDQWEDVLRMAVAHCRPRERAELFDALLKRADDAPGERVRTRIVLLAAACLEHATELDPAIALSVRERAARLIPPRTLDDANALATAGPIVLDLLPGPEGLDTQSALAVATTATLLASDAAIPLLSRFATLPSLRVSDQLSRSWSRFDTRRYADEVIARLPQDDLLFRAETAEQLDALARLGGRPRTLAEGGIPPAALAAYVRRTRPPGFRVYGNPIVTDLSFLAGADRLTAFTAAQTPRLADLTGLAGCPIESLQLFNPHPEADLSPIASLDRLDYLLLALTDDASWGWGDLPRRPLAMLDLTDVPAPRDGLAGIGRLGSVTDLYLGSASSPHTPEEWTALAALTGLADLRVSWSSLHSCPPGLALPGVNELTLVHHGEHLHPDLAQVPERFPALAILHLVDAVFLPEEIDLSPLAGMDLVAVHLPPRVRTRGEELLADGVVRRLYTPRRPVPGSRRPGRPSQPHPAPPSSSP
ncbi:NACHT domain-containing protein [Streptomyces sp. NPDC093546]|uniref:NACHT domain-containing protein n=1 Tax=Streptomyces sp. NPDC093546 TaxID=3366040 RepID=UPI0037FCC64A